MNLNSVLQYIVSNWGTILGICYGVSAILASLITALSNHPLAETWLHRVQGFLSWVEHADVSGFKGPFVALTRPGTPAGSTAPVKALVGFAVVAGLGVSCAWFQKSGASAALNACETQDLAPAAQAAAQIVALALNHGTAAAELEAALPILGEAGICAVEALVNGFEHAYGLDAGVVSVSSPTAGGSVDQVEVITLTPSGYRAAIYFLQRHGHRRLADGGK